MLKNTEAHYQNRGRQSDMPPKLRPPCRCGGRRPADRVARAGVDQPDVARTQVGQPPVLLPALLNPTLPRPARPPRRARHCRPCCRTVPAAGYLGRVLYAPMLAAPQLATLLRTRHIPAHPTMGAQLSTVPVARSPDGAADRVAVPETAGCPFPEGAGVVPKSPSRRSAPPSSACRHWLPSRLLARRAPWFSSPTLPAPARWRTIHRRRQC